MIEGDVAAEVSKLKEQPGRTSWSPAVVSSSRRWRSTTSSTKLRESQSYDSGVVLLSYEPVRTAE